MLLCVCSSIESPTHLVHHEGHGPQELLGYYHPLPPERLQEGEGEVTLDLKRISRRWSFYIYVYNYVNGVMYIIYNIHINRNHHNIYGDGVTVDGYKWWLVLVNDPISPPTSIGYDMTHPRGPRCMERTCPVTTMIAVSLLPFGLHRLQTHNNKTCTYPSTTTRYFSFSSSCTSVDVWRQTFPPPAINLKKPSLNKQ